MKSGEIVDSPNKNLKVFLTPIFFKPAIFHHPEASKLFTVRFFYLKWEQHY